MSWKRFGPRRGQGEKEVPRRGQGWRAWAQAGPEWERRTKAGPELESLAQVGPELESLAQVGPEFECCIYPSWAQSSVRGPELVSERESWAQERTEGKLRPGVGPGWPMEM